MIRKRWIVLAAAVLLIGGGAAYALTGPVPYLNLATGYVAQQTCACRYVSERALESCLADYPADAVASMNISTSDEEKSVSASVLGDLFSARAVYDEEFGCTIVD